MQFRFHSIMYPLLFLAIFCANSFLFQQPLVGGILLVAHLVWMGHRLGSVRTPNADVTARLWTGIWIFLSGVMIIGSIAYYIASVPRILFQSIVILSTLLSFALPPTPSPSLFFHLKRMVSQGRKNVSVPLLLAAGSILVFLGVFLRFVGANAITAAIRTPFDQITPAFLLLFVGASALVFLLLYRGREKTLSLFLFCALIGTLFSFLAIAYPIGYGFDPFIHKATEAHLAEFGTITPKPFYYIGQYSIVLFFSHAFSLPIDAVDTWLVPLLAAILLPLAWFGATNILLKKPRYALLPLVGLFLLPLETFTVTTPQGLANLWILLAVLSSVPWLFDEEEPDWFLSGLVTCATILIHPIAGIPLFFFFTLLFFSKHRTRLPSQVTTIIRNVLLVGGSLALPASFALQSFKSGQGIHLTLANLNPIPFLQSMNLGVLIQSRFNPLLDFVYLYGQNMFLIALVCGFCGWWIYRTELSPKIRVLFFMLGILSINYILLANVMDFSFLIEYERANYANRLLPLMIFFASPFLILALGHLSINLRSKPFSLKLTCLVLFAMIAGASFYLTFPRRDAYVTSRAFNVSQADVDAVYAIESWMQGKPYVVLANQSVSAAAIKHLGFRYYGNLFFYPIPTGDAMYQQFLRMNDEPSLETVQNALALVPADEGVHTLFYVVDTYWWQAERLIEQSKSLANDWKSIDGSVYVFRFDVPKHP